MKMKVCWLSAGVSSFIAGYIERDTIDKYIYIDIKDQHEDSMRFIKDCEKILGKKCEILKSDEYLDVEDAIRKKGIVRHVHTGYAPCTVLLKKDVRRKWEQNHADYEITYVWGFDVNEKHRADRLLKTDVEHNHVFPLIERNLLKSDAQEMCALLGVKRPIMYDLGYSNNNCIGCVKGGMGYWNKIRIDFPDVFEKRAKMERDINRRILKECFLDELDPNRGRMSGKILTKGDKVR